MISAHAEMPTHPTTFLPLCAGYAPLMGHHRHLLDDRVRTQAFRRAIARAVAPGDVVADLGTGTGVLAIEARRRGARTVYAIERDPIIHVAAAIARHNRVTGITWIEKHSRDVVLPEPVDVLVSECFGVLAFGGTMLEAVCDLRARHLRPGGRVVPAAVTVLIAPVQTPADFAHVDVWSRARYGLDFTPAAVLARNQPYNTLIAPRALLARPALAAQVDLARDTYAGTVDATLAFAARAGTLHGFAAWFEADLGGGVTLSTAPGRAATIWRQVYFPIAPIRLPRRRGGTPIELAFHYAASHFTWSGRAGDTAFAQSTRHSFPGPLSPYAHPAR